VIDKKKIELKIENITMVREYPDIFLEKILGLPLYREI